MTLIPSLIPAPRHIAVSAGSFVLDDSASLTGPAEFAAALEWVRHTLLRGTGVALSLAPGRGIHFSHVAGLQDEEFELDVDENGVEIRATGAAGAFYAAQTLVQLLPPDVYRSAPVGGREWRIPAVSIADTPRFAWRGVLLDVTRHFMPPRDIMRFIDLMALHRLNALQLHLTDDQGWRLHIERYPLLTEVGSWRRESQRGAAAHALGDGRPHGGFYTHDDVREIVAYARSRFITVVPEIETPGHVQAAIAAYPELGVGDVRVDVSTRWGPHPYALNAEESTVQFFRNVFDEVMELFPSPYIGVGGDECDKRQWRSDPRTQERMRELGLSHPEQLQSWFVSRLDEHITAAGRRLLGWDEILEGGLAPGATVLSWRGTIGAVLAAQSGHDVVVAPEDRVYLDYRQSESVNEPIPVGTVTDLRRSYDFEPVPPELSSAEARHVLGGQAALWSEHLDSLAVVEYFAFPRLSAIAERLWGTGGDFDEFEGRLRHHERRLSALGVNFRPQDGPAPWHERPDAPGKPRERADREAEVARLVSTIRR